MVSSDEFVTKMQFAFILTSSWCNRIDSTTNAGTPPADDFPAEVRAPPAKAIWKEPPAKPPPVAHTAYLRKEPPPKKAPPPAPGQFVSGMRRQVVTQGPEQAYPLWLYNKFITILLAPNPLMARHHVVTIHQSPAAQARSRHRWHVLLARNYF